MSNNNTPSSADDALKALHELSTAVRFASHGIKPTDDEAAEFKLALVAIRAFISGASDNQPQGELNATRLDTNDRATAGNRGARPDLQHIARDGHEPSGVESHPLRGGDGMVVGDIPPSAQPSCSGVHLPLDASAASAPLGWLYDWTHSSALGKPDEHFTGFTTDETYARKHDNPRPVWGAPDAANAGEPAALSDDDIMQVARELKLTGMPSTLIAFARAVLDEARPDGPTPKMREAHAQLRAMLARPTGVAADESTRAPDGEKYDDVLLPFLSLMRKELHANTGKGDRPGWLTMSPEVALLEVYYHLAKLQKAVKNNDGPGIQEYSADVANMAMMVLDICGGLVWVPEEERIPA